MTVCLIWGLRGNWPPGILHFESESYTKIIWLFGKRKKKIFAVFYITLWTGCKAERQRPSPCTPWLNPPGSPHLIIFGIIGSPPSISAAEPSGTKPRLDVTEKVLLGGGMGSPSPQALLSISAPAGVQGVRELLSAGRCQCWASKSSQTCGATLAGRPVFLISMYLQKLFFFFF